MEIEDKIDEIQELNNIVIITHKKIKFEDFERRNNGPIGKFKN